MYDKWYVFGCCQDGCPGENLPFSTKIDSWEKGHLISIKRPEEVSCIKQHFGQYRNHCKIIGNLALRRQDLQHSDGVLETQEKKTESYLDLFNVVVHLFLSAF